MSSVEIAGLLAQLEKLKQIAHWRPQLFVSNRTGEEARSLVFALVFYCAPVLKLKRT